MKDDQRDYGFEFKKCSAGCRATVTERRFASMQPLTTLWHLLSESITGYASWSLFQGLVPTIWFYPLNKLEVTGYEAFAVSLVLPGAITMLVGKQRSSAMLARPYIVCALRLAIAVLPTIAFTAAYPFTFVRLMTLSAGVSAALLYLQASLWNRSAYKRCVALHGFLVGYVVLFVSRIFYISLMPMWADFGTNVMIGSVIAAAAVVQHASGYDVKSFAISMDPSVQCTPCFRIGIGFGSLIFLTSSVYGEASIPCRWVGFDHPNPAGALVLVAVIGGFLLTFELPRLASSVAWFLSGGMAGVTALIFLSSGYGFVGSLLLAVYVFSVWPRLLWLAAHCSPGPVMTVAMTTYAIEMLLSVWTVAYNFVPGGYLTRERMPHLLVAVVLAIGCALHAGHRILYPEAPHVSMSKVSSNGSSLLILKSVLLLFLSFGLLGFAVRWHRHRSMLSANTVPYEATPDFSALVWTYHFGYDNLGWPSLEKSALLLDDAGADVIGLLETDASRPFLGNNDIAMWLGELLSMHVDFGPPTRHHTWGSLILSRHPIVAATYHILPSPHGELAAAVSVVVNVSGHLVDVVCVHMGNHCDNLDRKLQAEYLARLINESVNPVVFLGYVTSRPGSRDYQCLTGQGRLKDIDSTDHDRFCEYIMYRGLVRLGYARISRGRLSDTELQLAKFRFADSKNFGDHDTLEVDARRVPPLQHFNRKFGEYFEGHYDGNDHRYHMGTPKYFLPS